MLPKLRNGTTGNGTLKITAASGNEVTLVIDQGIIGPQGPAGIGVPLGGLTGQVLAKASDTNYDTTWISLSGMSYQGTWNAATNTPALASSIGIAGGYYIVSVAGNTTLNGISDWKVNDWAVFNGTVWQKIDNTDSVTSVNGQTGAVTLTASDVGAPSFNGLNATGTWNISVTGNAATANSATYATTAGNAATADNAQSAATLSGVLGIANGGTGSVTADNARSALGVPSILGVGASGTWGISVTGTANKATNIVGGLAGSLPYQTALTTTALLGIGTEGQVLTVVGGLPAWAAGGGGSSLTGFTQATTPFKTALGASAMTNATGVNNTAVGYQAGFGTTTGNNNTFVGYQAGDAVTIGIGNVAMGANTFGAASTAQYSIAIGLNAALAGNGSNNVIIGTNAGNNCATNANTFIGLNAGNSPAQATAGECIGIGTNALSSQNSSVGSVAIGNEALSNLGVGGNIVAVGYYAGNALTGGNGETFVGFNAGKAVTTGNYNTLIGSNSGALINTGANNVCLGSNTGGAITNGGNNTCLGFEAGKLTTNSLNTFVGAKAGAAVTTGGTNTIVGATATPVLATGNANTFIGVGAGSNVSSGSNNTVIGNGTLPASDTNNHVALYDGVGDLAVMFNDPGAMTFDGTDFGQYAQVLQSRGNGLSPKWQYSTLIETIQVAASQNLDFSTNVWWVSAISGNITLTLPNPTNNNGYTITVKRTDTSANLVGITVAGGVGLLEGVSTYSLAARNSIEITCDGVNYWITSQFVPPVALQAPVLLNTMAGDGDAFVTFTPVEGATGYEVVAVEK